MNKFLFTLCMLVMSAAFAQAQTSGGSMMIGGGLMFYSESRQGGSGTDQSTFSFTPGFGYFISDNFAIGTTLSIGSGRLGTGAAKSVETSFGIGPFARYYLFTSNEKFGFFGQGQVTFGTTKTDPPFGEVQNGNSLSFSLSPGAAFFFNEHWAAEFAFSLFSVSSNDPDTDVDDDARAAVRFGFNSLSPSLGVRYHF